MCLVKCGQGNTHEHNGDDQRYMIGKFWQGEKPSGRSKQVPEPRQGVPLLLAREAHECFSTVDQTNPLTKPARVASIAAAHNHYTYASYKYYLYFYQYWLCSLLRSAVSALHSSFRFRLRGSEGPEKLHGLGYSTHGFMDEPWVSTNLEIGACYPDAQLEPPAPCNRLLQVRIAAASESKNATQPQRMGRQRSANATQS
ncbi:hypothetical protein B0T17DRAFT_504335 [Bombardia bombarda]|uniref:Uncharacterized protein n=1 Tax=Bombardia bombarda TaxID=252184 RepID=A0AA40CGS1_9PEZI|nr:hypothetical protein B0T17DRAFT_504335 [Bombardia bombarda]